MIDEKNIIIEKAIAGFDFEKVHRVMKSLNWDWAMSKGRGVPTIDEMKRMVRRLSMDAFSRLEKNPYTENGVDKATFSSGGFSVTVYSPTKTEPGRFIHISFVLEESEWDETWFDEQDDEEDWVEMTATADPIWSFNQQKLKEASRFTEGYARSHLSQTTDVSQELEKLKRDNDRVFTELNQAIRDLTATLKKSDTPIF